jgi:hypothetical protein
MVAGLASPHRAANAPAAIHTIANTGDKESRKLAFAAPGTFGVCASAPLRAMQRDALLLSFFGPRYKKAAPCGAA